MSEMAAMIGGGNDDPRKLRDMLGRATALAGDHSVQSVIVGVAAPEAGMVFPQLVDFIESVLRVEDVVFRMTRERAVVFLADVDPATAKQILDRVLGDFSAQVALAQPPALDLGFYPVTAGTRDLSVKEVLPELFR